MSLNVRSPEFGDGQPIPKKYTGEGDDVSPPLEWSDVPEGTRELALVCDDPDAPGREPWVHWVICGIPPGVRSLGAGIPAQRRLESPAGARQGRNSWSAGRTVGYRGPLPPPGHGVHHYRFHLYALDAPTPPDAPTDKSSLLKAIEGHVLADGVLVGTYSR